MWGAPKQRLDAPCRRLVRMVNVAFALIARICKGLRLGASPDCLYADHAGKHHCTELRKRHVENSPSLNDIIKSRVNTPSPVVFGCASSGWPKNAPLEAIMNVTAIYIAHALRPIYLCSQLFRSIALARWRRALSPWLTLASVRNDLDGDDVFVKARTFPRWIADGDVEDVTVARQGRLGRDRGAEDAAEIERDVVQRGGVGDTTRSGRERAGVSASTP